MAAAKALAKRVCGGGRHVAECRPGRPLCHVMRKVQKAKYGVCFCPRVHFPHRRSYCERGGADRYAYGAGPEQPPPDGDAHEPKYEDEEAFEFFDGLAAGGGTG